MTQARVGIKGLDNSKFKDIKLSYNFLLYRLNFFYDI